MGSVKWKIDKSQKENKLLRVSMGGDLGISNTDAITKELINLEKDFSKFEIGINDVKQFDLSSLQVFIAFKKTCEANKKQIKFTINLPESANKILEHTGLIKIINEL